MNDILEYGTKIYWQFLMPQFFYDYFLDARIRAKQIGIVLKVLVLDWDQADVTTVSVTVVVIHLLIQSRIYYL